MYAFNWLNKSLFYFFPSLVESPTKFNSTLTLIATRLTQGSVTFTCHLELRIQFIILFNVSGFHEAVGDTIALSVSSPKHLRRVGLVKGEAEDEQTEINQLYKMVNVLTIHPC